MDDRKSTPTLLSEHLKQFFSDKNLSHLDHWFSVKLWHQWPSLVKDKDILKKTRPISYHEGYLVIWVENASHMQEVYFYIVELKQTINDFFKKECIKDISFTLNKVALINREKTISFLKNCHF